MLNSADSYLWLIPALPALGAFVIFFFSKSMAVRTAGTLASLCVGLAFACTIWCSAALLQAHEEHAVLHQKLWTWFNIDSTLRSDVAFLFDRLSMVFCIIITGVGFLIHVYSTGYMRGEEGERRYFGYLNLFVAAMLVLVLADNAFFMFIGWEGVGAMSFALIGHYYANPVNVNSARKAFLVTRFGDVFLLLGVLLVAILASSTKFIDVTGSGNDLASLAELKLDAVQPLFGIPVGELITIAGILLLAGAAGKSAQLPLQTWLPDAMAGPTPVSALIHAATMVTAGVYLIARFHVLYSLSPTAMIIVAGIGAATAFYGATCALVQTDIKRILAYSTISQIGYMILGLGVGAFSLGVFHFFTHAFYKALLFLAAGTVIHSLHGEQNIFNMGGLRKTMPGVYLAMLAGAASLAGIPLTAGFFSKDAILWSTATTQYGHTGLYAIGLLTALLTAVYSFRLIFLVFAGEPRKEIHVHAPRGVLVWPLYILAFFALFVGFMNVPHLFLGWEKFFHETFRNYQAAPSLNATKEMIAMVVSGIIALAGAGIAWVLYGPKRAAAIRTPMTVVEPGSIETSTPAPYRAGISNALFHGWLIDRLYDRVLVRGYIAGTRALAWMDEVLVDGMIEAASVTLQLFHGFFVTMQNGRLSRYAVMMLFGAVGVAAILFFVIPRGM